MYVPAHFSEQRPEELGDLIRAFPLGSLVTLGPDGLDANPIPFEWAPDEGPCGRLRAHVARANPVWQGRCPEEAVMVVFSAENAYLSPNWYPSKQQAHRQVPTWNYRVVNVHGRLRVIEDERFLRRLLARLTRHHEQRVGEARPWRMGDAPTEFIDGLLAHIVGLEIEVTRIEGKFKLSQNKDKTDREGAAEGVERTASPDLAGRMRPPPDSI